MTAPGWYNAEGDPPGSTRYWDGTRWVGDPVYEPSPGASGFGSPGGSGGYGVGGYSDPNASTVPVASSEARIGARLVDFVIALVIFYVFAAPMISSIISDIGDLGPNPAQSQVERIVEDSFAENGGRIGLFFLLGVVWDFAWVAFLGGTPGKLMLGLRVANNANGQAPPGLGRAALRCLNRVVMLVPFFGALAWLLVGLVSLVMLFVADRKRTVMDFVAGTVVVHK